MIEVRIMINKSTIVSFKEGKKTRHYFLSDKIVASLWIVKLRYIISRLSR